MKLTPLNISEVIVIEPEVFEDERGLFFEAFNLKKLSKFIDEEILFVQDNHSISKKGVIRGLHYQEDPFAQDKLVRVINGEIFDVAVDLRKKSPTYGKWVSQHLSSNNKKQLWIPRGFAHGFLSLSDKTEVIYKVTNYYSKNHEKCLRYDDNYLKINWPFFKNYLLSKKDLEGENFGI